MTNTERVQAAVVACLERMRSQLDDIDYLQALDIQVKLDKSGKVRTVLAYPRQEFNVELLRSSMLSSTVPAEDLAG